MLSFSLLFSVNFCGGGQDLDGGEPRQTLEDLRQTFLEIHKKLNCRESEASSDKFWKYFDDEIIQRELMEQIYRAKRHLDI